MCTQIRLPLKHPRSKRKTTMLTIIVNEIRTARKHHTLRCGCTIAPGQQYHFVMGLLGGMFHYEKHHAHFRGCVEQLH